MAIASLDGMPQWYHSHAYSIWNENPTSIPNVGLLSYGLRKSRWKPELIPFKWRGEIVETPSLPGPHHLEPRLQRCRNRRGFPRTTNEEWDSLPVRSRSLAHKRSPTVYLTEWLLKEITDIYQWRSALCKLYVRPELQAVRINMF